jgi:hypothetical protein
MILSKTHQAPVTRENSMSRSKAWFLLGLPFWHLPLTQQQRSLSTTLELQHLAAVSMKRGHCDPTTVNTLPSGLIGSDHVPTLAWGLASVFRAQLRPGENIILQRSIDLTKHAIWTGSPREHRRASTHVQSRW